MSWLSTYKVWSKEAGVPTLPIASALTTVGRPIIRFIVGLPPYRGHTTILMVVDKFSKGVHLGMLPPNYTAHIVALLFLEMVGKLHGMPRSLVSDRDPLFINCFWQELFHLSGTWLCMSSAYHPQMDVQMEVINRVVEQYLRAFVHSRPTTWGKFLMWAEWSYNTSIHSATGVSPFEITFGRKPPNIPQYITGSAQVIAVDELLINREIVFASLQKKLLKSQARMKSLADTHRREVHFEVGQWVMVQLQPHRQLSTTQASYSKLAKRFYGPFQILSHIGKVAYKLQLPKGSRIHPVFHCPVLKPFHQSPSATNIHYLLRPETSNLSFHLLQFWVLARMLSGMKLV